MRRLLPGRAAEHAGTYLSWLAARRILVVSGELLTCRGARSASRARSPTSPGGSGNAWKARDSGPVAGRAGGRTGAKPQILEGVLRYLVSAGQVSRLPGGLLVARAAVDRLVADLAATGWERFSVGQFKDRFGLSRKWAIPLLEHLDSRGVTRRIGDERQLRRS